MSTHQDRFKVSFFNSSPLKKFVLSSEVENVIKSVIEDVYRDKDSILNKEQLELYIKDNMDSFMKKFKTSKYEES